MRLRAAGSFARHRYEFDRLIAGGERIIRGNDIDTAPRELHSIEFSWQIGAGLLAIEARHVGRYFADAENQQAYPGHSLIGLQWRQRLKENLGLALHVDNLADREYADRADFAFGNWRYFPGRGRSAYLSLDWQLR
jgi:outer membrane receptor protein involved in Fe transport